MSIPDATDPNVKPAAVATDADTLAAEAQEAQTLVFPVMPETLLALAIPADTLKAVPASGSDTPVDQPLSLDVDASTSGRQGPVRTISGWAVTRRNR